MPNGIHKRIFHNTYEPTVCTYNEAVASISKHISTFKNTGSWDRKKNNPSFVETRTSTGDWGNGFQANLIHHKPALAQKGIALCSPPHPHQRPAPRATPRAGKQWGPASWWSRAPAPGGTHSRGWGGGGAPHIQTTAGTELIEKPGYPLFTSPKPTKQTDQCRCCISSKIQSSRISQTIRPPEPDKDLN